jgi:hypothetical protein
VEWWGPRGPLGLLIRGGQYTPINIHCPNNLGMPANQYTLSQQSWNAHQSIYTVPTILECTLIKIQGPNDLGIHASQYTRSKQSWNTRQSIYLVSKILRFTPINIQYTVPTILEYTLINMHCPNNLGIHSNQYIYSTLSQQSYN